MGPFGCVSSRSVCTCVSTCECLCLLGAYGKSVSRHFMTGLEAAWSHVPFSACLCFYAQLPWSGLVSRALQH